MSQRPDSSILVLFVDNHTDTQMHTQARTLGLWFNFSLELTRNPTGLGRRAPDDVRILALLPDTGGGGCFRSPTSAQDHFESAAFRGFLWAQKDRFFSLYWSS